MKFKINTRIPISLLLAFCILLMPIVALAKKGEKNFKQGMRYEAAQQWEKAAQEFTLALAADPSNVDYQLHFRRATFNASQSFMQQGRALAEQRDFVGAYNAFRQAFGYDPVNELAVSEMERMLHLQRVKETQNGTGGPARTGEPSQGSLGSPSEQAQEAPPPQPRAPEVLRVVTFSGDLKSYIRTLAEQLNLNVIFDRQSFVQPKTIDINLRDVTTSQALDYIFLQEGLFFQKLSRRTIVVADQTRRPQYQQLVLRTFFLANSEPEKAKILIGQAIPPSVGRPQTIVVADKDTNSLTVRDTAENVRLIGELLQSIDKDRAEVVMDVNIYEVSKSELMQFGNQLGDSTTLTSLGGVQSAGATFNGLARVITGAGATAASLPASFGAALILPASQLQALQSKSNTKLIASTQVHAFNGEESTARIGQRVPVQTAQAFPFGVQTGTTNPTPGNPFGGSGFPVINYEPTGLTLKFTPQVFPNHDVQVKMSIESKDVLGAGGLQPTFTERTITGTARVQNNRTMMLASVSQDVHTTGRRGLPILGLIPVLGRFFTAPTRDDRRIDIVIAVTPRVLRAPAITPRDEEMRPSGTLQSPTTGTLEAMLRESDREEQLAEWRLQQQNALAARTAAVQSSSVVPGTASVNPAPAPVQTSSAVTLVANDAAKETISPPATTTLAQQSPPSSNTSSSVEELPAFVPAPKSLVSNRSAAEVAAVNTNANLNGEARAVLTSLTNSNKTEPVEAVVSPRIGRTAQIALTPGGDEVTQVMKVGEKRRFAVELNSDVSLAMAVLALRFDPKVVKINSVSAGKLLSGVDAQGAAAGAVPSVAQSTDPTGLCLISISSLNGAAAMKGAGTLVFIEIEGVGVGDAAFAFEKGAMHLVATDARDVTLEAITTRAIVKQ